MQQWIVRDGRERPDDQLECSRPRCFIERPHSCWSAHVVGHSCPADFATHVFIVLVSMGPSNFYYFQTNFFFLVYVGIKTVCTRQNAHWSDSACQLRFSPPHCRPVWHTVSDTSHFSWVFSHTCFPAGIVSTEDWYGLNCKIVYTAETQLTNRSRLSCHTSSQRGPERDSRRPVVYP